MDPTAAGPAATLVARAGRRRRPGAGGGDALSAYLLISPAMFLLIVFVLIPALWIFWLSFQRWDLISGSSDFIGTANYARLLLRDDVFRKAVWQTVYFVAVTVPVSMGLGLLLALLLEKSMPLRDFLRTVFFAPYVMPIVSTAIIFSFIYHPDVGVLNAAFHALGLPKIDWLNSPQWVMPAIMLYSVWQYAGYNAVIFLAGLSNLPPELEEAARVDGAGAWTRFWRITWPLLSPTTYFVLLIDIIGSFKVVQPILVFTGGVGGATSGGGGPDKAAETIGYYLYVEAFSFFHAGYAGAISVVLFLIILAVTGLQMGFLSRRVFYR
ncbi:MAG TPA: sugar ABC transporter permease [Candidatus Dormibacteraeota bacterium]|nr:sugar ABC transporter permease [Candidatus Dormibacteraeota bacterium]